MPTSAARARKDGEAAADHRGDADYNVRILWPMTRWIEEHLGATALDAVLAGSGVTRARLEAKHEWISAEVFESILARARAAMPDDDTFMTAAAYRIRDAYGPIRYVLWATSPGAVFQQMVRTYHLVSKIGKPYILSYDRTHVGVRIDGDGPTISRLNCLVRQANLRAMPTLWGLPAAHVEEGLCIGRGDKCCEITLKWYVAQSVLPVIAGAIIATTIGLFLEHAPCAGRSLPLVFGILGAALGYLADLRRNERVNRRTRQEVMDALREVASNEAQARREMVHLNDRQKEWTRLLEEQMGERAGTLQRVVAGMQELQQERVSKVLGFSHDLRSPLQVIQFGAEVLRQRCEADADLAEIVQDMNGAVGQMKRMLAELVKTASGQQRTALQFAPERVEVAELTDRLQRRLRALVYGRDVRAHVTCAPDAPAAIEIDPLLLDRIVDNLLTNAAKYTDRGTIGVALDGDGNFLVIEIADTGCGIAPDSLDRIFVPGGSSAESRREDSFGVGLSVVVELLDHIGGRLEVTSRPQQGTTFWVYLPLRAGENGTPSDSRRRGASLSRVVHVRRLTA